MAALSDEAKLVSLEAVDPCTRGRIMVALVGVDQHFDASVLLSKLSVECRKEAIDAIPKVQQKRMLYMS